MDLEFRVSTRIARPPAEVFEAIADPAQLCAYFTTGGASGRLEPGKEVTWKFGDHPDSFPVQVIETVAGEKIVLEWEAYEGEPEDVGGAEQAPAQYATRVTILLRALDDGSTMVEIAEEGWRETSEGLAGSYGNCMGWSQMLCCLKAWMEHGINLREGMYKP